MSDNDTPIGTIVWQDLTVEKADDLKDFYSQVIGWHAEPVKMGGYNDYEMVSPTTGEPVTGICHSTGVNAGLPPQWLIYFSVADINESVAAVEKLGGEILIAPRPLGDEMFCVIRDPAGAICALTGN
jgi:predicted enzyme related to lactoylglutathione lyase